MAATVGGDGMQMRPPGGSESSLVRGGGLGIVGWTGGVISTRSGTLVPAPASAGVCAAP
ncbi:hypothetical protein [Streptomyces sp. NPDC094032]|uniref:hypothetical protein n=1 Tax=Streptomyces sp. NPDC094032 TaxID=3155308 RepID=UPI003319F35C